jgi:hypothetical protein
MAVVAKRFGGRVFSPKQLHSLVDEEFTPTDVYSAGSDVAKAGEAYSQSKGITKLDQVVKSADFTEFLLDRLFLDDTAQNSNNSP